MVKSLIDDIKIEEAEETNDEDVIEEVDVIPPGSKVFMGTYRQELPTGPLVLGDDGEIIEDIIPEEEGYQVLIDSYRATIGTVGGDGYSETVLYEKDGDYQIHRFSRNGDEIRETHLAYQTDRKCADELYGIIEEYGLKDYEGKQGDPLTGGLLVIKFREGDRLIRISSDNLPGEKQVIFDKIASAFGDFIREDDRLL